MDPPGAQAAAFTIVTWRAAFQRHGRSSWSWLILVRPETMRSSTSVRYSCGSIQLSFAELMSDARIDHVRPPSSLPANKCKRREASTVVVLADSSEWGG